MIIIQDMAQSIMDSLASVSDMPEDHARGWNRFVVALLTSQSPIDDEVIELARQVLMTACSVSRTNAKAFKFIGTAIETGQFAKLATNEAFILQFKEFLLHLPATALQEIAITVQLFRTAEDSHIITEEAFCSSILTLANDSDDPRTYSLVNALLDAAVGLQTQYLYQWLAEHLQTHGTIQVLPCITKFVLNCSSHEKSCLLFMGILSATWKLHNSSTEDVLWSARTVVEQRPEILLCDKLDTDMLCEKIWTLSTASNSDAILHTFLSMASLENIRLAKSIQASVVRQTLLAEYGSVP